jgi:hypothetical protein
MATVVLLAFLALGWLAVVAFALCLMAAAKRGDEQIAALSHAVHEDQPERVP